MARKEATLQCCMLTQFLKKDFWAWKWTDEETAAWIKAESGNVSEFAKLIATRLCNAGMPFMECYAIEHDSDTRSVWSELECKEVLERKDKHIHLTVKFSKGKGGTLEKIARAIGVEPQYIEKAGRGKYGYDNLLSYLIHAKDDDKYQYEPGKVVSMYNAGEGGKPYMEHYVEKRAEWEKGKAIKKRQKAEENIDELEAKILSGQVTKSQVILTDQYYDIYARFKRRCDDAFAIYGERRAYKTLQALQEGDFRLSVFFITGQAGTGKTRFAKGFVDMLARASAEHGETWRICQTAATNPLDDYTGEEILLMDDVRGGSLSASDWLKLLDPYNISPASARYHNRVPACRCIVITSSKEPLEFFYYTRQIGGDRSEALDQFMRRIQSTVQVIHADEYTRYRISDSKKADTRDVQVPGSGGVQVKLSYGFDEGRVMTEPEAFEYLLGKVEGNSNLNK